MRNGVLIDFVAFTTLSLNSDGLLVLSAVTRSEGGNYSCIGTNHEGTAVASFILVIERGLAIGQISTESWILSGSRLELAPNVGGTIAPPSVILWLHESEVVEEDGLVTVQENGSLVIVSTLTEHVGRYRDMAPGNDGWIRSNSPVSVLVKPMQVMCVCVCVCAYGHNWDQQEIITTIY